MRRIIIFTLLALTMFGGVAAADRYRGDRDYRDRSSYRDHRRGSYSSYRHRPVVRVQPRYVAPRVRIVRRPIYVQRPVIAYRYYNYAQRPALIVENYPARAGYIWVRGQWQWNGYEWIWQAGHYQPDPTYDQYQYNNQYDNAPYSDPYQGQYQYETPSTYQAPSQYPYSY